MHWFSGAARAADRSWLGGRETRGIRRASLSFGDSSLRCRALHFFKVKEYKSEHAHPDEHRSELFDLKIERAPCTHIVCFCISATYSERVGRHRPSSHRVCTRSASPSSRPQFYF
ncbi:hypothetical protein EVAR_21381_1 [Eumeta japonica]|uniref:Uncharacterized protein n=1 Tax=Eumeta variegata TaxID=151549 RepID=A0A4C1VG31_EUMVA|nr:hypothetical protein EVAR_21381_1 [Eumeta japonica]